jgi:hypothetical protein
MVEKGEIRVVFPNEDAQTAPDGRSYHISTSLEYLVQALWQLDLSPRDVMAYAGPLPWRSIPTADLSVRLRQFAPMSQ